MTFLTELNRARHLAGLPQLDEKKLTGKAKEEFLAKMNGKKTKKDDDDDKKEVDESIELDEAADNFKPGDIEVAFSDDSGQLLKVTTAAQWKRMAKNTAWSTDMADRYLAKGPFYVWRPAGTSKGKVAWHNETGTGPMDAKDKKSDIELPDGAKKFLKLKARR